MRTSLNLVSRHLSIVVAAAATLASLALGCGGGSSGGSGASSGSGGSGGSGGSSGGSGPNACSDFVTSPPHNTVIVKLHNNTAMDLFIGSTTGGGCGSVDPFAVTGPNGEALGYKQGDCTFTCAQAMEGACACPASCEEPQTTLLKPDGRLEVMWNGTLFFSEKMPSKCYDPSCLSDTCPVEREPPQGKLTFTASAWSAVSGCMMMPCTCTPDASGSCSFGSSEAKVSGTEVKATTEVSTIGGTIEIEFN